MRTSIPGAILSTSTRLFPHVQNHFHGHLEGVHWVEWSASSPWVTREPAYQGNLLPSQVRGPVCAVEIKEEG